MLATKEIKDCPSDLRGRIFSRLSNKNASIYCVRCSKIWKLLIFSLSLQRQQDNMLNLNILIMGNSRQQKAENRVKFPRSLGSVELFMYFCHE